MGRTMLKKMLGVGMVSLIVLTGCSSHPSIYGAEASGDGKTLHLEIAACNGDYSTVVTESTEEVRIAITDQRQRSPFYGDDCADVLGPLRLGEALGDRLLIDDSHRVEIPVRYYPWNQTKYSEADYLAAVEAAGRCVQEASPDAVVTITTHPDGYPDLSVEWSDLGDGEQSTRDSFPDCNNRYVEPLRR
jgi:hypothetical protein